MFLKWILLQLTDGFLCFYIKCVSAAVEEKKLYEKFVIINVNVPAVESIWVLQKIEIASNWNKNRNIKYLCFLLTENIKFI